MTQVCTGSFINVASTPFFIPLEQQVNEFFIRNLTQSKVTAGGIAGVTTGTRIVKAWFNPSYQSAGSALVEQVGTYSGNVAPISLGNLAQNGISLYDSTSFAQSATVAITAFTPGTTTVWTTGGHTFQVGDTVRVWGLTSAPQFSGLAMTITAVGGGGTTFTTLLDSTGATTSVGSVAKIGNYLLPTRSGDYPENRVIAKITNANPMVITTLVQQNYYVGDVVTFDIPTIFGVPQLSAQNTGLPVQATVISANNAVGTQTVTLAVDSTNFGVFATSSGSASNPGHWPLASGYPFTFPTMVPQGEGNINNFQAFNVTPAPLPYANQDVLSFAKQRNASRGILIGAGDGTSATTTGGIIGSSVDFWEWRAITSTQTFP